MKRRTFFTKIALGAAAWAVPAVVKAMGSKATINPEWFTAQYEMNGRRRTLADWLDDVRAEQPKLSVIVGSDACEYFRVKFMRGHISSEKDFGGGKPPVIFSVEKCPRRYDASGKLVWPYYDTLIGGERATICNANWINAPSELAIAYGGSSVFSAPFDRKTFVLSP